MLKMPSRKCDYGKCYNMDDYAIKSKHEGYNEALDEVLRLNADYEKDVQKLLEYCVHEEGCLCSQWRAGRPTEDGGYETQFGYGEKAKWYKRDEEPECTCGLNEVLSALAPFRGEK